MLQEQSALKVFPKGNKQTIRADSSTVTGSRVEEGKDKCDGVAPPGKR